MAKLRKSKRDKSVLIWAFELFYDQMKLTGQLISWEQGKSSYATTFSCTQCMFFEAQKIRVIHDYLFPPRSKKFIHS